jgi:hypothetical protein
MNTCTYCNYSTSIKQNYEKHILTQKHKKNEKQMKLMEEHKMFSCNTCEYHTKTKQNYNKHMQSKRHLEKEAGNLNNFICEVCNKPFGSYSGMLRHQNKCAIKTVTENKQVQNALQLLKIQPIENKNVVIINNNINQVNIQNIQNIQNILNEKCTKTPNLIDYFKTIRVKNDDIHKVYHENFAKAMITIIKSHLDKLPREQWPIFSIDEQTFIRDKNEWKIEKMDSVKEFINKIYDIIYKKYIENNMYNDKYREHFIYKEVKRVMSLYIKDNDLCTSIAETIIKHVSTTEEEFIKIFFDEVFPENKLELIET